MVHKGRGGRTYVIDVVVKTVGRIHRRSGTDHLATHNAIVRMIRDLADDSRGQTPRLDILRAIKTKQLTPMEVFRAYRANTLQSLPLGDQLVELVPAWEKWNLERVSSDDDRRWKVKALRYLVGALPGTPAIASLPERIRALKAKHRTAGTGTTFNRTRSAAMSFLRDTFDAKHPLYEAVQAIDPLKVKRAVGGKRLLGVAELHAFAARYDADVAACLWSMASTGMGPKEYWGEWELEAGRIHIEGTKRAGRVRDVPDVGRCVVPPITRGAFEQRVRKSEAGFVTPRWMRRSFAHWMEEAGVPRTRRRMYMGHGVKDVTDVYERQEVAAFLAADAAKLSAYIERELQSAIRPKIRRVK